MTKKSRSSVEDANALDAIEAAETRARDAEMRALLAEHNARWQARLDQERRENTRLVEQFRQELARDRLESQAQILERLDMPPAEPPAPPAPVTQPRDPGTGQWLPQSEPPADADLASMTMQQYAAYRQQRGMDQRGMDNVGRAPGHEREEFRGHHAEDGSGFPSWRDASTSNRVYDSQLADNRRPVPPGYVRHVRQDGEPGERWS